MMSETSLWLSLLSVKCKSHNEDEELVARYDANWCWQNEYNNFALEMDSLICL